MKRPITRSLLATAIEYAAQSKLQPLEWDRFFIQKDIGPHDYPDEVMEWARSETVRIFHEHPMGPLPEEARNELYKVVARLRQGPS